MDVLLPGAVQPAQPRSSLRTWLTLPAIRLPLRPLRKSKVVPPSLEARSCRWNLRLLRLADGGSGHESVRAGTRWSGAGWDGTLKIAGPVDVSAS